MRIVLAMCLSLGIAVKAMAAIAGTSACALPVELEVAAATALDEAAEPVCECCAEGPISPTFDACSSCAACSGCPTSAQALPEPGALTHPQSRRSHAPAFAPPDWRSPVLGGLWRPPTLN